MQMDLILYYELVYSIEEQNARSFCWRFLAVCPMFLWLLVTHIFIGTDPFPFVVLGGYLDLLSCTLFSSIKCFYNFYITTSWGVQRAGSGGFRFKISNPHKLNHLISWPISDRTFHWIRWVTGLQVMGRNGWIESISTSICTRILCFKCHLPCKRSYWFKSALRVPYVCGRTHHRWWCEF